MITNLKFGQVAKFKYITILPFEKFKILKCILKSIRYQLAKYQSYTCYNPHFQMVWECMNIKPIFQPYH